MKMLKSDVDAVVGADEDPDVHVDVHEKEHEGKPWVSMQIMREL